MFDFVSLAFVLWKSLNSPALNMDNREYFDQTQSKTKPFFFNYRCLTETFKFYNNFSPDIQLQIVYL